MTKRKTDLEYLIQTFDKIGINYEIALEEQALIIKGTPELNVTWCGFFFDEWGKFHYVDMDR